MITPTRNQDCPRPALASCVRLYNGTPPHAGKRITLQPSLDAVWLLLSGEILIETGDARFRLHKGDIAFLGSTSRSQTPSRNVKLMSVNFVWTDQFRRSVLDLSEPVVVAAADSPSFFVAMRNFTELVIKRMGNPAQLQPVPRMPLSEYHVLHGAFHTWLGACASLLESLGHTPGMRPALDPRLSAVQERLATHCLDQPVNYETLSCECGISRAHLERLFRHEFGTSPHKYFQRRRIEYACQQLAGSDMPIKVIAAELGFVNLSAFTTWFSHREHYPPREFRKLTRGDPTFFGQS